MLDAEQNAGAAGHSAIDAHCHASPVPGYPIGGSDTAGSALAPVRVMPDAAANPLGDDGEADTALKPSEGVPPAVANPIRRARRAVPQLTPIRRMPDSAANPNNCGGVAEGKVMPARSVPPAAVAPSADGVGRIDVDAQRCSAPTIGATCTAIQELQVRRVFYIRRTNMMDNAMRALVRRMLGWRWEISEAERSKINARAARIVSALQSGKPLKDDDQRIGDAVRGDVMTVVAARTPLVAARDDVESAMRKMAQSMPVWAWGKDIAGFGPLGLAVIIGEAGDLSNYATVSRLWKRLGLAVINGERQRKKANAEDAIAHGYNPRRRAEIWACVGDPLFKHQSGRVDKETGLVLRDPGPYRIIYDRAKAAFLERGTTKKHAHDHGMRLATKELIKDLWVAWRQ